MITNIIIGLVIFGYTAWTLARHIKKSNEGKCSGCSVKGSCGSGGCVDTDTTSGSTSRV